MDMVREVVYLLDLRNAVMWMVQSTLLMLPLFIRWTNLDLKETEQDEPKTELFNFIMVKRSTTAKLLHRFYWIARRTNCRFLYVYLHITSSTMDRRADWDRSLLGNVYVIPVDMVRKIYVKSIFTDYTCILHAALRYILSYTSVSVMEQPIT